MNHEVPQPITATRSPGLGNAALTDGNRSSARRQVAGCDSISVLTCDICDLSWCSELIDGGLCGGSADCGGGQSAGKARPAQALLPIETAEEGVDVRRVEGVPGPSGVGRLHRRTGL